MGVLRSTQSLAAEVEEMRAALQPPGGPVWRWRGAAAAKRGARADEGAAEARAVCVTGGISFLGLALVDRLLRHGYSVRLALETQEDLDKLREMDLFGENGRDGVWTIMANVMDPESLNRAFDGCVGVFHTSSLVDPGGISGYTKHMATLEAKAAEQVVEACVRTESVRKCVFTSSLLACVWRQSHPHRRRFPATVDESCWSDETFCREKKLWFALGKTMAEKAAWRAARGRDLKLVTVCPALVTGPGFRRRNSTPSIAYLKGAHTMLAEGVLATADVERVAEAHVRVYEAMGGATAAGGRYICYDHVVRRAEEFTELERQLGLRPRAPPPPAAAPPSFELCNRKLARLLSSRRVGCAGALSLLAHGGLARAGATERRRMAVLGGGTAERQAGRGGLDTGGARRMRDRGGGVGFGWFCPAGGAGCGGSARGGRRYLAAGRHGVTAVVRVWVLAPLEALFGGWVRAIWRPSPADGWLLLPRLDLAGGRGRASGVTRGRLMEGWVDRLPVTGAGVRRSERAPLPPPLFQA